LSQNRWTGSVEVSTGSGSYRVSSSRSDGYVDDLDPVVTAPGTDLI